MRVFEREVVRVVAKVEGGGKWQRWRAEVISEGSYWEWSTEVELHGWLAGVSGKGSGYEELVARMVG